MKKIKVIEVSSDTNIGGAGKCLLTLLENFDYNTFDVKVVLPKNSLLKPHIDKMNIPVIEVDGIADKSLDFAAVKKLRMIFKRERPYIVLLMQVCQQELRQNKRVQRLFIRVTAYLNRQRKYQEVSARL